MQFSKVARLTGKRRQTTHDLYREIMFRQLEHAEGGDFAAQVWKILYGSFLELLARARRCDRMNGTMSASGPKRV